MLLHRATTTLDFSVTCCRRSLTEGKQPHTVSSSEEKQATRQEYLKRYYLKNKDKIRTQQITNKDKIKTYKKQYQQDNKQKITEYQRTYRKVKERKGKELLEKGPDKRKNEGRSEQSQEGTRQGKTLGECLEGEGGVEPKDTERGRKEYFRLYYHKAKPRLQELWVKNPEKLQKYREENKQKLKKYRQRNPEKAKEYRHRNSPKIIAYRKKKREEKFRLLNSVPPSRNSWKTAVEVQKFLDILARKYHVKEKSDWYRVSATQVIESGGGGMINKFGGLFGVLKFAYPEGDWDEKKFSRRTKKSVQSLYHRMRKFLRDFHEEQVLKSRIENLLNSPEVTDAATGRESNRYRAGTSVRQAGLAFSHRHRKAEEVYVVLRSESSQRAKNAITTVKSFNLIQSRLL